MLPDVLFQGGGMCKCFGTAFVMALIWLDLQMRTLMGSEVAGMSKTFATIKLAMEGLLLCVNSFVRRQF